MLTGNSFGDSFNFGAGDLVSWSRLNKDDGVGMLLSIYNKKRGGRNVAMAVILPIESAEKVEICCLILRKYGKQYSKTI